MLFNSSEFPESWKTWPPPFLPVFQLLLWKRFSEALTLILEVNSLIVIIYVFLLSFVFYLYCQLYWYNDFPLNHCSYVFFFVSNEFVIFFFFGLFLIDHIYLFYWFSPEKNSIWFNWSTGFLFVCLYFVHFHF